MRYIVTKNPQFFKDIAGFEKLKVKFCSIEFANKSLPKEIAYDGETTGLKALTDKIFCFQLADYKNQYIVDLQDYTTSIKFKEYEDVTQTFEEVKCLLENRILIGHNICFDLGFLYQLNFFPKEVKDTFLASKIRYNGYPPNLLHNFKEVMRRELNVIYDKTEQANISKIQLSQVSTIEYSFNDVERLLELHDTLVKSLENHGSIESYKLHCRHIRAVAYMEQCGLTINTKLWKQKMDEDEKKSKLKSLEVIEYIWNNLPTFRDNQMSLFETTKKIKAQLTSNKQMIPVFESLGISILTEDGKKSIEEGIIKKTKHEFVTLWLEFQKSNHRVSSFGQNILDQVTMIDKVYARINSNFNPILDTARMSTRKGGVNILNLPSDSATRKCFEVSEGFIGICCDMDNQESRILADKSGDLIMIKAVLDNLDLHSEFARYIYPEIKELSDDEIKTNHKPKRQLAKGGRFCFA